MVTARRSWLAFALLHVGVVVLAFAVFLALASLVAAIGERAVFFFDDRAFRDIDALSEGFLRDDDVTCLRVNQ